MRLRMTAAAPVQVRIDRGVGTRAIAHCPRPDRARSFDGGYRPSATLRRLATEPLVRAAAATATVDRQLAFDVRLTPGLYRITVRAHGDEGRLSRPARRYLRVLG